MSEKIRQIPSGWKYTYIKNVAELLRGVTYTKSVASKVPKTDYLPVLRANNINDEINFEKLVYVPQKNIKSVQLIRTGDVIIAMSSGSKHLVGKAAQARIDIEGGFGAFCGLIRPSKILNNKYFGYFFQSPAYRKSIQRHSSGININNLRRSHIEDLSIPISPLSEQHRIVTKIEELLTRLAAGVEALKQVQAQLRRYRQSVLKAAVEGRLTAEWREQHKDELEPADKLLERILKERRENWEAEQLATYRAKGKEPPKNWQSKYKEPTPPDTTDLPELSEGWIWVTFGHIGELNRGKSKHRPRNDPKLYGGKYPFVQTGDIRQANKFIRDYSQTYNEVGLKQSRLWPKGTLCITIAANIADTAILDIDACFPDSVVGFMPKLFCNVFFIEYYLRTAKENLERYAPATAQKNINLKILNELAVPLPTESEQKQIVNDVDRLFSIADEVEKIMKDELVRSNNLHRSILKRAFEGKLVPQDPSDEPASVLLERIKVKKNKVKQF